MILVFILTLLFLGGYQRKYSNPNRLKVIILVSVFSFLVSLLVSYLSVYGFYYYHNPIFVGFSLPFSWDIEVGLMDLMHNTGSALFRIYIAGSQLSETEFHFRAVDDRTYIYPMWHLDVDITYQILFHFFLLFIVFNFIGFPLSVFVYKIIERTRKGVMLDS